MNDPVAIAIAVLNDALERDPDAIIRLVNARVSCNDHLAAHPTINVSLFEGEPKLGILGLLNGILGDSRSGSIGAVGTRDASTEQFVRIKRFVDLREGRLDQLV